MERTETLLGTVTVDKAIYTVVEIRVPTDDGGERLYWRLDKESAAAQGTAQYFLKIAPYTFVSGKRLLECSCLGHFWKKSCKHELLVRAMSVRAREVLRDGSR